MNKEDREAYLGNYNFLKNSMQAGNVELLPVIDNDGNERVAICHVEGDTFVPMAILMWDNPFDLFKPNDEYVEKMDS